MSKNLINTQRLTSRWMILHRREESLLWEWMKWRRMGKYWKFNLFSNTHTHTQKIAFKSPRLAHLVWKSHFEPETTSTRSQLGDQEKNSLLDSRLIQIRNKWSGGAVACAHNKNKIVQVLTDIVIRMEWNLKNNSWILLILNILEAS
jgi:hypothetical protein